MRLTDRIFFYEGDYISRVPFMYNGLGSSNFLVINGPEQVMIDSGMSRGPHMKRIARELKADGVNLSRTKRVLLSHTHPDHFLHAKSISRKNILSFLVHADSEPLVRRSSYQFEAHYNYPSYVLKEIFNTPIWFAKLVVNRFFGFDYLRIQNLLNSNDRIDLGVPVKIIHLPSHFPGHIGIYFSREKIFYAADLFDFRVAEGGIINNALSSYEQIFKDIEKVRKLDIEMMIPGHGRIIKGKPLIKTTLDRIERGTENYAFGITALLEKCSRSMSLKELTQSFFYASNSYNLTARKIIIYNTLMHLRSLGRADFCIEKGESCWRLKG